VKSDLSFERIYRSYEAVLWQIDTSEPTDNPDLLRLKIRRLEHQLM
jgi:hypothetical protein